MACGTRMRLVSYSPALLHNILRYHINTSRILIQRWEGFGSFWIQTRRGPVAASGSKALIAQRAATTSLTTM
jgi:hypothetical protein